eukprot:13106801-Heterocapsa_arctica.AAC.1
MALASGSSGGLAEASVQRVLGCHARTQRGPHCSRSACSAGRSGVVRVDEAVDVQQPVVEDILSVAWQEVVPRAT